MKTLVSSWLLLSSAVALTLSIVVFSKAADTSSPAEDGTPPASRPALRGPRALGPFTIFDTNHDGVISADEIAHAAAALRKLDKNGDGKLTPDELRPPGSPPPPPPEE
ncbi:MAG TPA: EF-hand domain-containing protein [Rariglobus sp.]|jgi:hypothetical protein|nr:EF-hand domain-containing protein [Rariglobus sp.]